MGVSPGAWLLERRLREAKHLLREERLTISEIALRCGVNSASYFSRMFRKKFGCTPIEWQRDGRDS
jgi:AraC-like DNA-binding protein